MRSEQRRVALVLPVFDEAQNLPVFHRLLDAALASVAEEHVFEFVYVDDGSRDGSLDVLIGLRDADPRVTVLSFSRNYGHQAAITAGLDHAADADAVVIMDTDLQDPPSVVPELVARWRGGADVVYAQRRTRRDGAFKRLSAHLYYRLLARVASIEIPRNTGDFRLMDRRVVDAVRQYREHDRFLRGIVADVGFRQEAVLFDRDARQAGTTGYPLRRMVKLAMDGMLGFSTVPLQLISRLGAVMSLLAVVGVAYALGVRLLAPQTAVPGWAFVTVSMFLLGGIQLMMLGVLGAYIGRIYLEVKRRPLYTVAMALPASTEVRRAPAPAAPTAVRQEPERLLVVR